MNEDTFIVAMLAGLVGACSGGQPTAPPTRSPEPPPRSAQQTTPTDAPPPEAAGEPSPTRTWTFDGDSPSAPPVGFSFARTGRGRAGRWVVRTQPGAPSEPNVLAQLDVDDTDDRYPVAVADAPSLADVSVSVRCNAVSGTVDQACGVIARYHDEDNYIVTRANALEDNVRLYTVREGRRHQLASWSGAVTPNAWHELRLQARGDHIEVFWDGSRVIDHRDATFVEAGRVGMWTKADSVTYFDDLRVEPL